MKQEKLIPCPKSQKPYKHHVIVHGGYNLIQEYINIIEHTDVFTGLSSQSHPREDIENNWNSEQHFAVCERVLKLWWHSHGHELRNVVLITYRTEEKEYEESRVEEFKAKVFIWQMGLDSGSSTY